MEMKRDTLGETAIQNFSTEANTLVQHGSLTQDLDSGQTGLSLNSCLPFSIYEMSGESHTFPQLNFPHL